MAAEGFLLDPNTAGGKHETVCCLRDIGLRRDKENGTMRMKRALLGLVGVMVLAAVGFTSTVPSFLRSADVQEDGIDAKPTVKPASRSSAVATHTSRSQATGKLKPDSSAAKTAKKTDRKTAQAALALTGCKDNAPANGTPAVLGEKNISGKKSNNSKEKSLCNPESPRSR